MTTDFRALCAELIQLNYEETSDYRDWKSRWSAAVKRARAALAEPEPEPEGPTDEELEEEFGRALLKLPGDSMNATAVAFARAVLARWGTPNSAETRRSLREPADGEVAELAAWLRGANWDRQRQTLATRAAELLERLSTTQKELERERLRLAACGAVAMADTPETAAKARDCLPEYWSASADDIARQIDKLMRLSPPQPVPVSERLPGPGDCDAEGRCWLMGPRFPTWDLNYPPKTTSSSMWTHWLPAHALPLPS